MASIIESDGQIQIKERVPTGVRIFLFIVGLFPWIAPYEFFFKSGWRGFDLITIFSAIISLGAIVVSLFFLAAAIFGLNQILTVDAKARSIVHAYENVITPLREKHYSFGQLKAIEIETNDWSDGPSTHRLKFLFSDGHKTGMGSFASLDEAHSVKEKINQMVIS